MQRQAPLLGKHLLCDRKGDADSSALLLPVNLLGLKILQKKGMDNLMCLGTTQLPPVRNEQTSRSSEVYVLAFPFLKAKSAGDEM